MNHLTIYVLSRSADMLIHTETFMRLGIKCLVHFGLLIQMFEACQRALVNGVP